MIFKMNIPKKKWAVVVEVVITVPHHIKNLAVISTGIDNTIMYYIIIYILLLLLCIIRQN